jgi:hypothetical protein
VKRLLYLVYYLRHMNWYLLRRFMDHTRTTQQQSVPRQGWAMIRDSLHYNISPLEWYQFGFAGLDDREKATWVGTGTMYEAQRRLNPPGARAVLDDKRQFYQAYRAFFRHAVYEWADLAADPAVLEQLLQDHERLVLKAANGKCGATVVFINTQDWDARRLLDAMRDQGHDLLETPIEQHPDLNRLSPSGVNTVRIITALDDNGAPYLLGCRLRISVDSAVDNLAAGNLAAPIDEATGMVNGPGVYSDITQPLESTHPITGEPIDGFQVPYWRECVDLALTAAQHQPQNRSIGWDIAVTPDGPGLIEGNHDWCKLVWQLPVGRGLKAELPAV